MMVRATPTEHISRTSNCSKPMVIGPRDRRLAALRFRDFLGIENMVVNLGA
jgi:hypothetical protein